jgi:hypothetical protein
MRPDLEDLAERVSRLERMLAARGGGDDQLDDEDELDSSEDFEDLEDEDDDRYRPTGRRLDEPGQGPGSGHPRDVRRAFRQYNEAISRGIYGADIARLSAGAKDRKFKAADPIDKARLGVTRFARSQSSW